MDALKQIASRRLWRWFAPVFRDTLRFAWWAFVLFPWEILACWRSTPPDPSKILLVRPDALGDFVLWLDALRGLRELYPQGRYAITLAGNESWLSLAQQIPDFDDVWGMDRQRFVKNPVYRYQFLKRVRQSGFGLVLNTVFSRDFLWSDAIARASGAPLRIGWSGDHAIITPWLLRFTGRWYSRLVNRVSGLRMELQRNAEFVRAVGNKDFLAGVSSLPVPGAAPVNDDLVGGYYVIVPGAGKEFRQWPPARYAEIAERLYKQTGWVGVAVGGTSERELCTRVKLQTTAPLRNLAGRTRLPELVRLISAAQVVISNETGAIHIAASLGTPAVSITGGGHYGRYVPYQPEQDPGRRLPLVVAHEMPCFGCNWNCIYQVAAHDPMPCVEAVTVDAVWTALLPLLGVAAPIDPAPHATLN